MKQNKLIKTHRILYTNKRARDINELKVPKSYLDQINRQKKTIDNYWSTINRVNATRLDVESILSHIPKFTSIVEAAQIQRTQMNSLMTDTINKVNRILNDNLKAHINLINNITSNIDFSKLREAINLLEESLKLFIRYCEQYRLSMKLEYFSDYYDIYLEKSDITDEDIYRIFKSHYPDIKSNLTENDFYQPKEAYIYRIIDNFENKRYTEAAMLALAAIDYLTIYRAYQEEREPKYKSINTFLNKDILGNEEEIEQIITQYTVKVIKEHYSNNNAISDPDYINRNRLMHGVMDIKAIKKIDCIKLIYLIDVLSSIEIELVES
ncbi:hypothetical protein [Macrococcus bovicus]|uniref:Uncharacterized protein n=1 Tax=Macrococcus bovicus TaxID=69968 RepID=A0A4R6BZ06_9STAP|nr:hypothetical protein [Macrococcus bovicus]TDM13570.1 hypothetical protein ERX55_08225 [Macrococcus bovicus]